MEYMTRYLIDVLHIKYLLFCIIVTTLSDLLIALLFGYRKKNLIPIVIVSIINHLYLYIYFFTTGVDDLWFYLIYPVAKLIIFIVEAIVYNAFFLLITNEKMPAWKNILYPFTANIISLIVGYILLVINEST